ncbi:MAG: hypothetical protein ACXVFT_16025 [Solirubrobacteraceae bacterium]
MDFAKEDVGDHNEAVGTTRLHVDDTVVVEGLQDAIDPVSGGKVSPRD